MPRTNCIITGFAITSVLLLVGCNNGGDDFKAVSDSQPEVPEAAHGHHHEQGPNGGHIIELGDDEMYHAELVFDEETRKTTIYILDGEVKSASPIDAEEIDLHLHGDDDEVELTLTAAPLPSDDEGKSSRFELAGDELPESVKGEENFEGHLHVMIDGEMRNGNIEHHEHGEEGHDHDEDKHGDHKDDHDKDGEHKDDGDAPTPE